MVKSSFCTPGRSYNASTGNGKKKKRNPNKICHDCTALYHHSQGVVNRFVSVDHELTSDKLQKPPCFFWFNSEIESVNNDIVYSP